MDLQNEKCVMVIDEHLPLGIITNAAAIMGITVGKKMPEVVGTNSKGGKQMFFPFKLLMLPQNRFFFKSCSWFRLAV